MNNSESLEKKAEEIIDAIQRADEVNIELKKELEAPINKDDILEYFEYFIKKTQVDLKNTINGCVKSRNKANSRDDLKKYSEGYFNEIIQNANDAICNIKFNNPIVEIKCKKESNNKYFVECSYPDSGFSLENIYGFCTRGNSNKNSEIGQEGMYGIGIKSLFCFVDELCIESNIIIKISSREKLLDDCEIRINDNEFNNRTTLKFSFIYYHDELEKNKHAGFNVKKLASFIDDLYNQNLSDYKAFFLTGKDEEIVFDIRSLFFTELRGKREIDNSIKEVIIKREDEEILVLKSNEEVLNYDNNYNCIVKKVKAYINDDECEKYVLLHFKNEDISLAFEYNKKEEENEKNDRLYSTYYVGENEKGYLGIKTGCLINTKEINSSRSGLEHKNEKEPEVLNTILKKGQDAIRIFCKLATNDQNVIDVLCNLIYLFRYEYNENNEDISPKYIFDFDDCIKLLEETMHNCIFDNGVKYILKEEDGVDNKTIIRNRPMLSDDKNIRDLYNLYDCKIKSEKGQKDLIIYKDDEYNTLSNGIKVLSRFLFDELMSANEHSWIEIIDNKPFLYGIKDLLKVRIGGDNLDSIVIYLGKYYNDDEKILVKQLVSRYELNDCFDGMGNYTSANVAEWLFNPNIEGVSDDETNNFSELGKFVRNNIMVYEYYFSNHWNAKSDGWRNCLSINNDEEKLSDEKLILQVLRLIKNKVLYVGYDDYSNKQILYRTNKGPFLSFWNRTRRTNYWDGKMSIIHLDLIDKQQFNDFENFKIARDYIDEYNDNISINVSRKKYLDNINYKLNIIKSCKIENVKYENLNNIFKWLAEYDSNNIDNDNILEMNEITDIDKNIEESDLIRFVKKIININAKIKIESINVKNNGKKFIGYITKKGIFIKCKASKEFKKVGEIKEDNNSEEFIFIFCSSSCENEQNVMSDVLKNIGYGDELCSYIENYISCGNVKNLPSSLFNIYLKKDRLVYEYPFEVYDVVKVYDEETKKIDSKLGIDDIYDILSSEMSYDNHCPFCNQIPTLNVIKPSDGINEYTKKTKRNSLIIMMNAKYNEKKIYLKLLCCKSCFNQLMDTLTEAIVEDVENEMYKKLILKSRIVTSCRERELETVIKISPDNWEIICSFNGLKN